MIAFRRRSLWQSILLLWPPNRRKADEQLRENIRWLVQHPEAPCVVGDTFIPNGYGTVRETEQTA